MKLKKAFTLIELLVVIAIIALLVAILFPVIARARDRARQSTCLSNMKQMGLAIAQYSQDFDEYLPYNRYDGGTYDAKPARSWDQLVQTYLGQHIYTNRGATLFQCPNDMVKRNYGGSPRSYVMVRSNGNGVVRKNTPVAGVNFYMSRRLSEIQDSAQTLVLAEWYEGTQFGGNVLTSYDDTAIDAAVTPASLSAPLGQDCSNVNSSSWNGGWGSYNCAATGKPGHNDGWNYLFADGHAKWLRPEMTVGTIGTTGKNDSNGSSYTCSLSMPCGMWTINPND